FCDIPEIPPRLDALLGVFVRRGGAIAFAGMPPRTSVGRLRLIADPGMSDKSMKLGENSSPILARTIPGSTLNVTPAKVCFLKESPRMGIDARWGENARAVTMHIEANG